MQKRNSTREQNNYTIICDFEMKMNHPIPTKRPGQIGKLQAIIIFIESLSEINIHL